MWEYCNKFDSTKSLGVCCWCVKIPQCGYMGHGLKFITFYVQKHIVALEKCHNPTLVRDKPLGAPISVNWSIGISAQKPCQLTEAEWRIYASVSLVIIGPLIMAWHQFSAKPWSEAILSDQLHPREQKEVQFQSKFKHFYSRKCIWKCYLQNGIYFASASINLIKSSEISFVQNTQYSLWNHFQRLSKTWCWYSRTLCKISKGFDNWLISYGKVIFHVIMGTHDSFCVYHVVIFTYAWKKNNHPFILTGKILLFAFQFRDQHGQNLTVVNGQCGQFYIFVTSTTFRYYAISTETC